MGTRLNEKVQPEISRLRLHPHASFQPAQGIRWLLSGDHLHLGERQRVSHLFDITCGVFAVGDDF